MVQSSTVRGTDLFQEINAPGSDQPLALTYWDLWFGVVLLTEFGGDWAALIEHFRRKVRGGLDRHGAEPMLNHALNLRRRLEEAHLPPEALLGQSGPELLRRERRRARKNILEKSPHYQDRSDWMIYTPRVQREARAMRGYWDRFPVSPISYADRLTGLFKTSGYYTENQSFALERKLSSFIDKRLKRATLEEELALDRAFLTVLLEQANIIDDSYGVIGQLYGQMFESYVALPRQELPMSLADFFQDLLELLIWEGYGFTYQEQPAFFAGLTPAEAAVCEPILRTQWQELDALDLLHQSEEALTMLGLLCTQHGLFEQFVALARVMGTRHWQRITRMAERAEQSGRADLALAVYEAALEGPGMHQRYLREKYEALKQRLDSEL